MGPYAGLASNLEKIGAVLARQVGDREALAFAPQDAVGEGWNVRHVNTGADRAPALAQGAQGLRHKCADRRINDCSIKFDRWDILGGAGPARAERPRQRLRRFVILARERKHRTALPARD